VFPSSDKPLLSIPDPDEDLDLDDEDEEEEVEKHLDMPASWCLPIEISSKGRYELTHILRCSPPS